MLKKLVKITIISLNVILMGHLIFLFLFICTLICQIEHGVFFVSLNHNSWTALSMVLRGISKGSYGDYPLIQFFKENSLNRFIVLVPVISLSYILLSVIPKIYCHHILSG